MRRLVYFVATSLDGFIADPAGDTSAFPTAPDTLAALFELYPEACPAQFRAALGIDAPPRRFDTVLMGYRTYAPALEAGLPGGAYPHLRQVVVSHRELAPGIERIGADREDLAARVATLKAEPGSDIWLCGGADVAGQLVGQIDEIQVKINPILLGDGTPLLRTDAPLALTTTDVHPLPGGVVLATYEPASR